MDKFLAGNWKLFKTREETRGFFAEIGTQLVGSSVRKAVATSPTLLETALASSRGSGVEIFSQNCAWADSGAWTGEVSPLQLKDLGIKGTLIGHSERRQFFGDNDESCVKRAMAAWKAGIEVIYCIGENIDQRKAGKTADVLMEQMKPVLGQLLPAIAANREPSLSLTLAYEPVWAIGTGLVATTEQVAEAHKLLADALSKAGFGTVAILYGGSVKPENIKEIASVPKVAGALVGGASLTPASFVALHNSLI